jgi:hypothetical protein
MDLKKEVKDIIKWAQESEENKAKSVKMATTIIMILNNNNDINKMTDDNLEKCIGAGGTFSTNDKGSCICICHHGC